MAVGRKNWLFCGDPRGAVASSTFFSLSATARANGIDPAKYFPALFEQLPYAKTIDDLKSLLPQYIDRSLYLDLAAENIARLQITSSPNCRKEVAV